MSDVLAKGFYCNGCGLFEEGEVDENGGRCQACGHPTDSHVAAFVVRADSLMLVGWKAPETSTVTVEYCLYHETTHDPSSVSGVCKIVERSASITRRVAVSRHDYEPGEETHPMHTDPLCRVCGGVKKDIAVHT